MYPKDDKRRLYQLMDMYLSGTITALVFCDEFYYSYDLEIDYETLSSLEYRAFSELNKVSNRFSEFEEDHKLDPKAFFTEKQLLEKILETKEKLQQQSLR